MNKKLLNIILILFLSNLMIADGDDCPNCYNPIANAGFDETYYRGDVGNLTTVCLDGSNSFDPEGSDISYMWTVINPENVELTDSTISNPCFTALNLDYDQEYLVRLRVSDSEYLSEPDFVSVHIVHENTLPYFTTYPLIDFNVKSLNNFTINLSTITDDSNSGQTDDGYNVFSFDWNDFESKGFNVESIGNNIFNITAPPTDEEFTILNGNPAVLEISDYTDVVLIEFNIIVISNEKPYAVPGENQTIWAGDSFIIDGSNSFDPENPGLENLIFNWTIPEELDTDDQSFISKEFVSEVGINAEYEFSLEVEETQQNGGLISSSFNGGDLIFSEYNEFNAGTERYIEIFNTDSVSKNLNGYEVWYVDGSGEFNWSGSSNGALYPAELKMIFNACYIPATLENDFGCNGLNQNDCENEGICKWLEDVCYAPDGLDRNLDGDPDTYTKEDCCLMNAEPSCVDCAFGDCNFDNDLSCLLEGFGKWRVPYFNEEIGSCQTVNLEGLGELNTPGTELSLENLFELNLSSGVWYGSAVDDNLDIGDVIHRSINPLSSKTSLVISKSSENESFQDLNYVSWGSFNHTGDDSYAIVRSGEIIDVIGDASGNNLTWNVAGVFDPLTDKRIIRKFYIYDGNINWVLSGGSNPEDSEWVLVNDNLDDFSSAGTHYCGVCDNTVKINSVVNNYPMIDIAESPGFSAAKGNEFTLDASNSYDPDGYDLYYFWESNLGLGLGCADGVSSSEEDCCINNPINCTDGISTTKYQCCESNFGNWNPDASEADNFNENCEYSLETWIESNWQEDEAYCKDFDSNSASECCVNNSGSWFGNSADEDFQENCIGSIALWDGNNCEILNVSDSEECCEQYGDGLWDDSLEICFGGNSFIEGSRCTGSTDLSEWNLIKDLGTSTPTFEIVNQPGTCNEDEFISERDCCVQNIITPSCTIDDLAIEECCLDLSNIITPYCSDDPDPDNPTFSEEYCCNSNGGVWNADQEECGGNPTENWIETYFDSDNVTCVDGVNTWSDIWIHTYWDYDNDVCINSQDSWNVNPLLQIKLIVTDGIKVSSDSLQIAVQDYNTAPVVDLSVDKMEDQAGTIYEDDDIEEDISGAKITYENYKVYLKGSDSQDYTSTGSLDYRWEPPPGISLSPSNDVANPTFNVDEHIAASIINYNGEPACAFARDFPDQFSAGQNCTDDSYDNEEDCCELGGDGTGVWNVEEDGSLGELCENQCCWNEEPLTSWNNCYVNLKFKLTVSDGGYIEYGDNIGDPSSSTDSLWMKVIPEMPIINVDQSNLENWNSGCDCMQGDEIEYVKLDVSNSYDPNGDDLTYSWVLGAADDGVPNVIKSGYCVDDESLPCIMTECENEGFECMQSLGGDDVCSNSDYSCYTQVCDQNSCISNSDIQYVKIPKGLGSNTQYSISVTANEENFSSLTESIALEGIGKYPIANAGLGGQYAEGDQIILNGLMSNDPQEYKVNFSYWGARCSDGISIYEEDCTGSDTWYEDGFWQTDVLGILAFYEVENPESPLYQQESVLVPVDGYSFIWNYDVGGYCSDDADKICYLDSHCDDGSCIEHMNSDTYLPLCEDFTPDNLGCLGYFDNEAVNPFFTAPELEDDDNSIEIMFNLKVSHKECLYGADDDWINHWSDGLCLGGADKDSLNCCVDSGGDWKEQISFKDTIFVNITPNGIPVAFAGEDVRAMIGTDQNGNLNSVKLDGSSSYDDTPTLSGLEYSWAPSSENHIVVNLSNAETVTPSFELPYDLCVVEGQGFLSFDEKACCEDNGGTWKVDNTCYNSNSYWSKEKSLDFILTVSDGLLNSQSDTVTVVYSAYSYPVQPKLYVSTEHENITLYWDDLAKYSTDDLSLYSDFQGYKIYRSEDYGETWGQPIYRDGELRGYEPFFQYDLDFEQDSLYCLKSFENCNPDVCLDDCEDVIRGEAISGNVNWYQGYDWQNLGNNSGLKQSVVDTNVVDGIDYVYTITSYDRGYKPDSLEYGRYGNWDETTPITNDWDNDIWVNNAPIHTFTEYMAADSFYFYKLNYSIESSYIVNGIHTFKLRVPSEWNLGQENEVVSQDDVDSGVNFFDVNVIRRSTNPNGYPGKWSYETEKGSSEEDQNYVFATAGYRSSNIKYPDEDNLDNFIPADCRSIGNGDVSYELVSESELKEGLVKLEVQGFSGEDGQFFENYSSLAPCVYSYSVVEEFAEDGRLEHNIDIDEDCFENCGSECSFCRYSLHLNDFHVDGEFVFDLNPYGVTEDTLYETSSQNYSDDFKENSSDFAEILQLSNLEEIDKNLNSFDNIIDLPGVVIDTTVFNGDGSPSEAYLYIPNYLVACHPLMSVDEPGYRANWTDFFNGIRMRFDNAYSELPEDDVSELKKSYSTPSAEFMEALNFKFFGIEAFGHIDLLYFEQAPFNKRPSYNYEIELLDPMYEPLDTALASTTDVGPGPQQACGRPFSTLVPFKIKNLITNKYVALTHTDNGMWNGDATQASITFPTPGIPSTHPGFEDCVWTPGEWLSFTDSVKTDEGYVEEVTFKLEFIYNDSFVGLFKSPYMCRDEFGEDTYRGDFELGRSYNQGDCVSYEGLFWLASDDVSNNYNNVPNLWYDYNGFNQNPWITLYPWTSGQKLYLEPYSWYVDGDYWVADMSMLGDVQPIEEYDLSKISVVPNPYIVSSAFNESTHGNRIRFTRLPSKCKITIFTISGELVDVINHESMNNNSDSNEWWDLKNSSGRKVAPGLYIYQVETDNGLTKIGKFAVVR